MQVFDPELPEPGMHRVPAAVRAVLRRRQVRVPPGLLGHPARGDAEFGCRGSLDEGQVLRIVRGVVHRLAAEYAAVSYQVGKEPYPVLGPAKSGTDRLRGVAGYGQPVTSAERLQGRPAGEG